MTGLARGLRITFMPQVYYHEIYLSLGQSADVFRPLQGTFGYKAKEEVIFGFGELTTD